MCSCMHLCRRHTVVTVYVYLGLQEMANTDIVGAALAGSLELVCQALKAGVPVDTTDEVCK